MADERSVENEDIPSEICNEDKALWLAFRGRISKDQGHRSYIIRLDPVPETSEKWTQSRAESHVTSQAYLPPPKPFYRRFWEKIAARLLDQDAEKNQEQLD